MCVIVAKPAGSIITEDIVRNCWSRNPDGAGFAIPENGRVIIRKGYMQLKPLLADLKKYAFKESPLLLHFRITTHGNTCPENTHPFQVNKHLAVAHNGMFYGPEWRDTHKSDTALFVDKILRQLPAGFHHNDAIAHLLAEFSSSSKLAFIDAAGKIRLINGKSGTEEGGIWYSNDSFKASRTHYGYGGSDTRWVDDDDYYYDEVWKGWRKDKPGKVTIDTKNDPEPAAKTVHKILNATYNRKRTNYVTTRDDKTAHIVDNFSAKVSVCGKTWTHKDTLSTISMPVNIPHAPFDICPDCAEIQKMVDDAAAAAKTNATAASTLSTADTTLLLPEVTKPATTTTEEGNTEPCPAN